MPIVLLCAATNYSSRGSGSPYRLTHHLFQEAWEQRDGHHPRCTSGLSYLDDYVWGSYAQPSEHTLKTNDSEPLEVNRRRLMAEAIAFIANLQPIEYERQAPS